MDQPKKLSQDSNSIDIGAKNDHTEAVSKLSLHGVLKTQKQKWKKCVQLSSNIQEMEALKR